MDYDLQLALVSSALCEICDPAPNVARPDPPGLRTRLELCQEHLERFKQIARR